MKLEANLPLGHDALLFSISGTGSFICPVAQTRLDIPRPLFTQSWTTGGKSKCSGTRQIQTANQSVHSRTRQAPDHDDCPNRRINYTPGPQGGIFSLLEGSSAKTVLPRIGQRPLSTWMPSQNYH